MCVCVGWKKNPERELRLFSRADEKSAVHVTCIQSFVDDLRAILAPRARNEKTNRIKRNAGATNRVGVLLLLIF